MRNNKATEYLIIFAVFCAIFFIYTYPLILDFNRAFLGEEDAHIYIFNSYSYANSSNPLFTDWILYPIGDSLIMHTNTLAMSAFANLFTNDLLGINCFILLNFALSGLGAYVVSKKFIGNKAYAFICAFVFAFSSYKTARLMCHTNLILTAFVPFFIYFFLNLSEETKRFFELKQAKIVSVLGFLITFLLSAISDYVVTICGMYFLFSYALYFPLARLNEKFKPNKWKVFGAIVLLFILFDLVIQMLRNADFNHNGGMWYGGDLVSFFIPFNNRFVGSQKLLDWYYLLIEENAYTVEGVMYAGYSLIILGILAFILRKSVHFTEGVKGLLFSSVFLTLICLPQFRILGKRLFFSPTAIHHFIPVINQMRAPIRVFYVLIFVLAIVIFYTLLNSKWKASISKKWVAWIVFVVIFIDYYPAKYPIQVQSEVPEVYHQLAKKTKESLLVYPFGIFDGYKSLGKFDKVQLSNIRIHRKKVFGGHLSRLSEKHFDFIRNNYFLSSLCALEEGKDLQIDREKAVEAAKELPIDYIIIPFKYRSEKGAIFLEEAVKDKISKVENVDGDLLITLE